MEKIIGNFPISEQNPEFHEYRNNEVEDVINIWTNLISDKILDTMVFTLTKNKTGIRLKEMQERFVLLQS